MHTATTACAGVRDAWPLRHPSLADHFSCPCSHRTPLLPCTLPSESMRSARTVLDAKVSARPSSHIAASAGPTGHGQALPPTGHGDLHHGCEGNKRDRFGVAGPSRVGRSHGTGQPLKALIVFFLVFFPCCSEAVGWKWGTIGQTCTAVCASVGQTCVQGDLVKVNNQANFDAVKGPGVVCDWYESGASNWRPYRYDFSDGTSNCYYRGGTGGTCAASYYNVYRVCPCTCPANTISLPLQPWPCPR